MPYEDMENQDNVQKAGICSLLHCEFQGLKSGSGACMARTLAHKAISLALQMQFQSLIC